MKASDLSPSESRLLKKAGSHISFPSEQNALPSSDESSGLETGENSRASGLGEERAESTLFSDELVRLLAVEAERDALMKQNQLLCGVNEKLVLATLEAQSLRDEAEAANHRQNEFLAMLAHELRNPLAPISMAGSMLARTPSPSTQILSVQKIIERQVLHLSRLLDDLLDAARINSGKITLVRGPVVLADQLLGAIETVEERMTERGQELELHIPSPDTVLHGDSVRLAQVFSNLLVNASKFTQDGGKIVVSAWVAGDNAVVEVADNGAGMSSEVIPNIFSLFTQGPRSLARSEGGLGVGLNVVRNVVEMHGGSVAVRSPGLGHGSVFTLVLPLLAAPATPTVSLQLEEHRQHSHRVLLVEDNRDASEMLSMLLQAEGFTVVAAFDGITGLETAKSQYFDVLVCDIGLPDIDGYSLISSLRATGGKKLPTAIAVSGYGQVEDRARALAAGFEHYLVKPINADTLISLIESTPPRRACTRK